MPFPLSSSVQVGRRPNGEIHNLEHLQQPFLGTAPGADVLEIAAQGEVSTSTAESVQSLANDYLREVAPIYGFPAEMVPGAAAPELALADSAPEGSVLRVN